MYSCNISIKGVNEARAFVTMAEKYPDLKIILKSMEYSVDAHSIIGLLSLDLNKPIEFYAEGDDMKPLIDDLKPYTV